MVYGGSNPPLSTSSKLEIRSWKLETGAEWDSVSDFYFPVSEKGGSNSVVESQPSKLLVAGSIPVSRSSSKLEIRNSKLGGVTGAGDFRVSCVFRRAEPM